MSAVRFPNGVRARALALLVGLALASTPAAVRGVFAAPRPVEEKTKPGEAKKDEATPKQPIPNVPELRKPGDPPPTRSNVNDVYRAILRQYPGGKSPADTLGNGVYSLAREAFYSGRLEEAVARANEFTRTYTRNLNLNDALEMTILIRGYRDFEDEPIKAYGRMLALREAGRADSAAAAGESALARWPGARIRYHLHFQLAELARDRGDHAAAMTHALAVADPSSKSRLAPAALKLAGDESIAAGQGQDRALRIYQDLLERYPDSPLAPEVRSQVLEMRKRLQL